MMTAYYCDTCDNLYRHSEWDDDARMCIHCAPPIDEEEE
jgi:hypothetical protein